MKILAIDSSAGPVSAAVIGDGVLMASAYGNTHLTHSQTLLPMVEDMLKNAALTLEDMEALAVSVGPGSFTGVRIGVAAVKGLAFSLNKPCAAVSTLEAMAYNFSGLPLDCTICAAMDARCAQVYAALFSCRAGEIARLTPDQALPIAELAGRLESVNACADVSIGTNMDKAVEKCIILVGDGAQLCYNTLQGQVPGLILAPAHLRYQQAAGVAAVAEKLAACGGLMDAAALQPVYLRLPQAERELRLKQQAAE